MPSQTFCVQLSWMAAIAEHFIGHIRDFIQARSRSLREEPERKAHGLHQSATPIPVCNPAKRQLFAETWSARRMQPQQKGSRRSSTRISRTRIKCSRFVFRGSNRSKFVRPEVDYKEKQVCVSGKIAEYRGVPEIVADDPKQITIGQ